MTICVAMRSRSQVRPPGRIPGEQVCRRCGRRTQPGARFCPSCGLRLAPTHSGPERQDLVRGVLLRDLGRLYCDAALRSFRRALRKRPGSLEAILEIARTYDRMSCPARARRWYRRAVRREPACVEAWVEGARTFAPEYRFRQARWLGRAMRLRPGDRLIAAEFGEVLSRLTGWRSWFVRRLLARREGSRC